jgi:serine/threonine protein kinase
MLVTTYYPKGSLGDKVRVLNDTEHNQHNDECRLNGDLSGLRTKGIKHWEARYYFIDMLKALFYIHEVVKVVHKDIKPDNIMIGEDNQAVLIDFGVSAMYDHDDDAADKKNEALRIRCGTYMFFAPELFGCGGSYTFGSASDLWAIGITFYYLLTGQFPYEDARSICHLKELVIMREINTDLIEDKNARHCITRLLNKDPTKRATFDELLEMDWVTDCGNEKIDARMIDTSGSFGDLQRVITLSNPNKSFISQIKKKQLT